MDTSLGRPKASSWQRWRQAWGQDLLPPSISPQVPPFASFSSGCFTFNPSLVGLPSLWAPLEHLGWCYCQVLGMLIHSTDSCGALMSEVLVSTGSPAGSPSFPSAAMGRGLIR